MANRFSLQDCASALAHNQIEKGVHLSIGHIELPFGRVRSRRDLCPATRGAALAALLSWATELV